MLDIAFQSKAVGIFALEMDRKSLYYKAISMRTGIDFPMMISSEENGLTSNCSIAPSSRSDDHGNNQNQDIYVLLLSTKLLFDDALRSDLLCKQRTENRPKGGV